MHFIVTAYDGTDENAYQRRLDAREAHLANAKRMMLDKKLLYAAALLGEDGKMIGSMMIAVFPSEADLRADWLAAEPYVTGGAWEKIEIAPCKVPDFCLDTRWMDDQL